MNNSLRFDSTLEMSADEWLAYRKGGIGASEVSTVLGLNPWKSSIQLYYEKLGEQLFFNDSLPAFLGKYREDFLAEMWEYWDGSQEGMMKNYREGKKVRRCKKINAYVRNPDYPWLFVSLDREINKGQRFPGGVLRPGNGALELKEIGGYEANKWEAGFPIGYIMQNQTQIGVCRYEFGEMGVLRDNQEWTVLPFDFSTVIFETIVTRTKVFWDKVLEGRKVMTQRFEAHRNYNMQLVEELDAEMQKLEPEPDGSEAYTAYMKEKYKIAAPGEMMGGPVELVEAQAHKEVQGRIKELEEKKRLHENNLKNKLRDNATKIDFGSEGYVSWAADKNGTRRFLNSIKQAK